MSVWSRMPADRAPTVVRRIGTRAARWARCCAVSSCCISSSGLSSPGVVVRINKIDAQAVLEAMKKLGGTR
jgi:hypothetical protein